jgi:transcriptional regulator with XRE-family HTH domain
MIDNHIAARIRERRIMLGLTQQQFAEKIGVTYQQAHKYEHGINRISAGRLYEVACALDAPITYFYEGVSDVKPPHSRRTNGWRSKSRATLPRSRTRSTGRRSTR